jgi:alpha,alpha-trehalase
VATIAVSNAPFALSHFPEIAQRLRAKRLAAFFDFDGTLSPIAARPDGAALQNSMRRRLEELSRVAAVTAIVSGRSRQDLEARVGLPGLIYAGCHGLDIAGPQGSRLERQEGRRFGTVIQRAVAALTAAAGDIPGAVVEDKSYCVALHYRGVAASRVDDLKRRADAVAASFPELRKTAGKKVIELRPDIPWDKGCAVHWILEALELTGADVLPLYIGDDVTDEDAFRALAGIGIGVYVSNGAEPTLADYRLRSTGEVRTILERLVAELQAPSG